MPLWVKGNTESGIFIIYFHGGPCGNCFLFSSFPAFKFLEEDFAVVYWSQRCSSNSLGNASESSLTISQFVQDTDRIIDYILYEYSPKAVFIMAHSWGGRLAKEYLIKKDSKIRGYIEINGVHNMGDAHILSRNWVIDHAKAVLENPNSENADYWAEALDWYEENPVITLENREKHYDYIHAAEGQYVRPQKVFGTIMLNIPHMVAFSPYHPLIAKQNSGLITIMHKTIWEEYNTSLDLSKITLPVLICWGEFDAKINLKLGKELYDNLGTPAENKKLIIFHNSGHAPHFEEPEKFYENVRNFIFAVNQY